MARAGASSDGGDHGGAGPSRRAATIGDNEGSSGGGRRIRVFVEEDVLEQAARVRGQIRRGGVRASRFGREATEGA